MNRIAFTVLAIAAVFACGPIFAHEPGDDSLDALSRAARLQGGAASGYEAERAPLPGAHENAVELGRDLDGDGDPDEIHIHLEVIEVQEEVYPGEFITFWVFAPLGSAMGQPARLPSPTIRVEEGDRVFVTLHNTHYLPHTIHFHGMSQANNMDGVPDVTQHMVLPGHQFTYRFDAKVPGTYWYHCHVQDHVHVLMGLAGMIVVEPNRPDNHFAHLIPGAGRIAPMAKATAETYQGEYSLVYMDIDDRLNRIPAAYSDPREIERRMHRDYDVTPDADVTLPFHCHVATHEKTGMAGQLVVGTVIATIPSMNRLIVNHEEIKGFMAAMEMSYPVKEPKLLDGLKAGDKIKFVIDGAAANIIDIKPAAPK